jgi:3-dehydroquinate synthase
LSEFHVTAPGKTYPVIVRDGLLDECGAAMAAAGFKGKCLIVTNKTIGAHYAGRLQQTLQRAGLSAHIVTLPDGESFKTLDTMRTIYQAAVGAQLERHSCLLALGGGVITDMTGFAAATYMRGVPLINIPTTLLAMVDAGIGGKTGVDLPEGKNLVGAFKQPEMVLVDPELLTSLPEAELKNGLAEAVKAGVIASEPLFRQFESGDYSLREVIEQSIAVKVVVIQEDPLEKGRRAVLNLGHTFGHAYELLSGYRIRHGQAVAWGMVEAAYLAEKLGVCTTAVRQRIEALIREMGLLPEAQDFKAETILEAMSRDKKKQDGKLRFILPRAIGDVDIFPGVDTDEVLSVLRRRPQ